MSNQATRFEDSAAATAHLDQIQALINCPKLAEWCAATDANFTASTVRALQRLQNAILDLQEELEEAS